jgi:hypothetical protein
MRLQRRLYNTLYGYTTRIYVVISFSVDYIVYDYHLHHA